MIQLFHVTKAYPGDPPALDDVSVHVAKGEFVFLTGASGAGKSTLLKLLFAAEHASQGQVVVAGRNLGKLNRNETADLRRRIGVVFQDFKLLQTRTVADNVGLTLEVLGVPPREVQRKVAQLLRYVGLSEKAKSLPSRLSGGEQQRAAIARALVSDPALVLADEPTGSLDSVTGQSICKLLDELCREQGRTVVVVTHEPAVAVWARRVVVLKDGRFLTELDEPGKGGPQGLAARYQAAVNAAAGVTAPA